MAALRWLYTVAAGFAVVQSVQTFALAPDGRVDFQFTGDFVVFLVFTSVVVRFSHGAIRHFYKWYDEKTEGWLWYQPLTDFFGLFLEAFFFLLMALALKDHSQFAVYYFCLLAADTFWLFFVPVGDPHYRNWLLANCLFFVVTIPVFIWLRDRDTVLVATLAAMTIVHHVLDYVAPGNWHYYFPDVPAPPGLTWIKERWGNAFLKAGDLLWGIMTVQPLRERVANRSRGTR